MSYPYIIQGSNITVVVNGKPSTLSEGQMGYDKLREAIKTKNWAVIPDLVSPTKVIAKFVSGHIQIVDGVMFHRGTEVHNSLARRIASMCQEGFDIDPMVKFFNKLQANPSRRACEEIYNFMEKCNLPITEDGNFLAYKKVRSDYMDCHSGTVLNAPYSKLTSAQLASLMSTTAVHGAKKEVTVDIVSGKVRVSMPRNMVDDVADNHCSVGLHFCSFEYLKSFSGDRIVVLEIDPSDVVSIPTDYNFAKGRTSSYLVVDEIAAEKHYDNVLETGKSVVETPRVPDGWTRMADGRVKAPDNFVAVAQVADRTWPFTLKKKANVEQTLATISDASLFDIGREVGVYLNGLTVAQKIERLLASRTFSELRNAMTRLNLM